MKSFLALLQQSRRASVPLEFIRPEPQASDHEPTLPDSLALCCTSSLSEARWTFSFLWKTDKLEHRGMPTWMYYYTSAHSHGPSLGKGFGTALPIVGLIDPGQLQHLCLGSSTGKVLGVSMGTVWMRSLCHAWNGDTCQCSPPAKGRKRARLCAWW